jgi:hypothetical protein
VGVPQSEAVFATNPVNFMNERTLKRAFEKLFLIFQGNFDCPPEL